MQRGGTACAGVTWFSWIWIAVLVLGAAVGTCRPALAGQVAATAVKTTHIHADSGPYHLSWDGAEGTLVRDPLGVQPERRLSLVFLHTDPGPRGYANHLAWFLARDSSSFMLLWCYLNDTGSEFYCWLYDYPSNQLTSQRFEGDYRFVAPAEPIPPTPLNGFDLHTIPHYDGPDFTYRNWTRTGGSLAQLNLFPAHQGAVNAAETGSVQGSGVGGQGSEQRGSNPPSTPDTRHPTPDVQPPAPNAQHLSQLRIYPLQEVHVASGNGWRSEGWRELHCLAFDATNAPYYLILYSNSTRGFAIDLRQAQISIADFDQTVAFTTTSTVFGATDDRITGPPELHIQCYIRHEIDLTAGQSYANPYTDVLLEADLRAPDGRQITVPGFWDGDNRWKIRIAPTMVGEWTWHTRSNDSGLNGQEGIFTCTAGTDANAGFLLIDPTNHHRFAFTQGNPFLPVSIAYPVHHINSILSTPSPSSVVTRPVSLVEGAASGAAGEDAYLTFQHEVDSLAALGFNRFVGEYLIDPHLFAMKAQRNEGGPPFVDYDPDRLNPAYFQAMDRRLEYCNSKGIVPDIGIGMLNADLFKLLDESQMRQLWRYILARYSAYNVCWNLFGREIGAPEPDGAPVFEAELAQLTRRFDPDHHPLSLVLPGSAAPALSANRIRAIEKGPQQAQNTAADPDYVTSPAGLPLWPQPSQLAAQRVILQQLEKMATLGANVDWLDYITLNGGDLETVSADYRYNKPVCIYDRSAPSTPDAARYRLWETHMRGGYWAREPAAGTNANVLDSPETHWESYCAQLFKQTRYWRLVPHSEILLPSESGQSLARAENQGGTGTAPANLPSDPAATGGYDPAANLLATSTFVLADPAWEYVIYFEHGGEVNLDLLEATGNIKVTWFNPRTGEFARRDAITGGAHRTFRAPDNNDWVLYLSRR